LLRFVKEGICAHGTEGVRASVRSKSSQLQCRLRLEGICGIRSRITEQARLLRLLLRVCSKGTETERILLWLRIVRVRSRSEPAASKNVCWLLLLLLLRLLRVSKERLLGLLRLTE
jgi:hypothetical protein